MSEDIETKLGTEFKASQQKYTYFLLAGAASAIGFAMTQSKVEPLNYTHAPLGVAVGLWAISFVSGLRFLENAITLTHHNWNILAFKRELLRTEEINKPEIMAGFMKVADKSIGKIQSRMIHYGELQSWCLLLGGLAYIAWHVSRMWFLRV